MLTDALDLVVDGLAAYRATRLIVQDTLVDRQRDAVVRAAYTRAGRAESVRRALAEPDTPGSWSEFARHDSHPPKLAELATCPYCASVWVGFAIVAARALAPRPGRAGARALALAAIAPFIVAADKKLAG